MSTRRVTVIHPWLPQYRVEFFEAAIAHLADRDVELTVAHGAPPPDVRDRGDAVTAPWAVALRTRGLRVGGRAVLLHSAAGVVAGRDLVVTEQAIRNVETYGMTLNARRRDLRVALWGHGRTSTKRQTDVEGRLKDGLTRRGHWFFAYTEGGAAHAREHGFPPERITVVQNSVDTANLRAMRDRADTDPVDADRVRALARSLGLSRGRTVLALGALDPSKRLDVLLDTGRRVARELPGFRLVLGGGGPLEPWVREQAAREPWLCPVGPVFGQAKADLGAAADLMLVTGRVGLIAVDSFALRLPIVTPDWPLHAPEFEYLRDGVNAAVTADSADALAARVVGLLHDRAALESLQAGCVASAGIYTLEAMVSRFSDGVIAALDASPRWAPAADGIRGTGLVPA
jgi:glycosyltransferase involved in cell wall biosynthesis